MLAISLHSEWHNSRTAQLAEATLYSLFTSSAKNFPNQVKRKFCVRTMLLISCRQIGKLFIYDYRHQQTNINLIQIVDVVKYMAWWIWARWCMIYTPTEWRRQETCQKSVIRPFARANWWCFYVGIQPLWLIPRNHYDDKGHRDPGTRKNSTKARPNVLWVICYATEFYQIFMAI